MNHCVFLIDLSLVPVSETERYLNSFKRTYEGSCDLVLYRSGVSASEATNNPKKALELSLQKATQSQTDVVFIKAPLLITESQVFSLQQELATDPLFGMTSPRFATLDQDLAWTLPTAKAPATASLTRRALATLPEHWIIPEILTGCILLRNKIVANPPPLIEYSSIEGVLSHFLCAVRRRSFRMLINNRIVVRTPLDASALYPRMESEDFAKFKATVFTHFAYPVLSSSDSDYFSKAFPAADHSFEWYENHPCHRLESLCAAAFPSEGKKRRILIDCRSMLAHFCGTTTSQLGFLGGFEKLVDDWEIHVIAQDFAIKAHHLVTRFPKLQISEKPTGVYAAMVHMSQPCYSGIIKDLHAHAFAIAGNILDTITWDMILGAPPEVEKSWNFTSQYFDCLFYNSNFSKAQFNRRFPVPKHILQRATHHSVTIEENTLPGIQGTPGGDYILIFGNNYDHKDVFPTANRIKNLFPREKIIALGPESYRMDNVTFLQSGNLPDEQIDDLIAKAKMLIFPSWIEGFGMPVVKALAYGKPVLVRSLPLWQEIAGIVQGSGVLMEFEDEASLQATIQGVIDQKMVNVIPQGGLVQNGKPKDWQECAKTFLDVFDLYLKTATCDNWIKRDQLLQ